MSTQTYQEAPISLGKAAKKYGIPQPTLTRWAKNGRLKVLQRPERKGQPLLVDEASVILARQKANKYAIPATYPQADAPAPAPQQLNTAELVKEYCQYAEDKEFEPSSMERLRQVLGKFAELCPTLPLTPQEVLNFIHNLPHKQTTRKNYYKLIRMFYNYLVDFHNIKTPLSRRTVPKSDKDVQFRVLSREEVLKILDIPDNFQDRVMLEVLYSTRIRIGELLSLTSDNIFQDHIMVRGKTGTWEVPISEELYDKLNMLGPGTLFNNRSGKPLRQAAASNRVRSLLEQAGITGAKRGAHTFRHTSLTHLYEDTGDIPLVQEAAHHADIATTMIYTHPRAVKQKEKLLEHDPLKKLTKVNNDK